MRQRILVALVLIASSSTLSIGRLLAAGDSITVERSKWISTWGNLYRNVFDPKRPTIIVFTSVETCLSCGGSGIKETLDLIEKTRADANVLVVTLVEAVGDSKRLRKLLTNASLIEDTENISQTVFGVDTVPCVQIIAPDGSILYRRSDPTHKPVTIDDLLSHVRYKSITVSWSIDSGIPLSEGDCSLSTISSCHIDYANNKGILLDRSTNQLLIIDLKAGAVVQCIEPDSTMDLHLLPVVDTIITSAGTKPIIFREIREIFTKRFIPMTKFISIVGYNRDTCHVITDMYTSPLYDISPSGKYQVSFKRSYVLLSTILQRDKPPIILKSKILSPPTGRGWEPLPCHSKIHDGHFEGAVQSINTDTTTVIVGQFSPDTQATYFRPVYSSQLGSHLNLFDDDIWKLSRQCALATIGEQTFVFLPHVGLFQHCIPRDTMYQCNSYIPSLRLRTLLRSAQSDDKSVDDTVTQFRYLHMAILDNKPALVFLSQQNRQLIIEQYGELGIISKEFILNFRPPQQGDILLSAYILDPISKPCSILCKWKKSRWYLYQIELD